MLITTVGVGRYRGERPRSKVARQCTPPKGQYVCIYDPKNNKMSFYPCAWTRREMLSQ